MSKPVIYVALGEQPDYWVGPFIFCSEACRTAWEEKTKKIGNKVVTGVKKAYEIHGSGCDWCNE